MPPLPILMIQVLTPPPILRTMRTLTLISSIVALLSIFAPPLSLAVVDIDTYISTEGPIAKAGLLANIGPSGSKADGALAGVVRHIPVNIQQLTN
jgi:hypothetical protein